MEVTMRGVLLILASVVFCATGARAAKVPDLWVLPEEGLSPAEQALASTLQGVANQRSPQVWLGTGGMSAVILAQLRAEGTRVHTVSSVWDLVKQFRGSIKGAEVFEVGTPSLNVAASLCGLDSAVAVDASLLDKAKAEGLPVIHDARGEDSAHAWATYGDRFTKGLLVDQSADKPGHLRDFAVAHKAFCFDAVPAELRTQIVVKQGPHALVFGWGPDEYHWISDISRGGGSGVAADWCLNLSAMEHIRAGGHLKPRERPAAAPPQEGERVVAFVLSDGDNVQWLCGGMPLDSSFYGSKLRGTFPMTWEVSPLLGLYAPRVLQYLYNNASPNDDFVAAGAPGYSYTHLDPDRAGAAAQTARFLKSSGMSVVSVINSKGGTLDETAPLLNLKEADGVIYKDFAPYNGHHGETFWRNGKPCVSYKYLLWEGMGGASPDEVAKSIAAMPASPQKDPGSYALVNVHAWSWKSIGGPMEAVRRTIAALPPNTRVVTAGDLLSMLRRQFGRSGGAGAKQ